VDGGVAHLVATARGIAPDVTQVGPVAHLMRERAAKVELLDAVDGDEHEAARRVDAEDGARRDLLRGGAQRADRGARLRRTASRKFQISASRSRWRCGAAPSSWARPPG
jgi:hypothetical protein